MNPDRPESTVERRDAGLAMTDALLEQSRPLQALPASAHARVKRRLEASARRRSARRLLWLQPAVVGAVLLVCGVAFGIAIDRLVLDRRPAGKAGGVVAMENTPRRPGKAKLLATRPGRGDPQAVAQVVEIAPPVPETMAPPAAVPARVAAATAMPAPAQARRPPGKPMAMRLEQPAAPDRPAPTMRVPPPIAPPTPVETQHVRILPPTSETPAATPTGQPEVPVAPGLAPAPPVAKIVPPAGTGLTEERLLAAAVRALRSQGDARSALAALDEYGTRYPHGRLWVEASALRADALTALGRTGDALAALDGLDLTRTPGGLERQVQRGELRSSAGRWREAKDDFDWVILHARTADRALVERAQRGREQTRVHLVPADER